jgi:hypothetical protein
METATPPGVSRGQCGRHAPTLDPSVLAGLDEEVPGAAIRFASAFIGLWGRRSSRLAEAVWAGDPVAALDAVLSVKTSAAMVGALRLSCRAAGLELALRAGAGDIALLCEDVLACGDETLSAIRGHLGQHGESLDAPAVGMH